MDGLEHALEYGVIAGSIYAVVSLGYALIYSVLRFIHFAHGDLVTCGAYFCWFFGAGRLGCPLPLAILLSSICTGILATVLGRAALMPARRHSLLAPLLVAIALSFVLQNLLSLGFGPEAIPFYIGNSLSYPLLAAASVSRLHAITILGAAGAVMFLWHIVLRRTKIGLEIRALAANPLAARVLGLRQAAPFLAVFFISGVFAGLAGVVVGLDEQLLVTTLGFSLGIRAFIASVIGGITNFKGAILGAFVLGLVEKLALYALLTAPVLRPYAPYISEDTVALLLFVVVIVCRPRGLFSRMVEERP